MNTLKEQKWGFGSKAEEGQGLEPLSLHIISQHSGFRSYRYYVPPPVLYRLWHYVTLVA